MSTNPYVSEDSKPTLLPSVFAFIDILGYNALTNEAKSSGTQQQFLERVYAALSDGRKWLDHETGDSGPSTDALNSSKRRFALKAFTDNIVIGWPIRYDAESEFGDAFGRLAWFQSQLVLSGFFVRGAISYGSAYVDDIAVSGDVLLEAYDAERNLARDPRIVLTESAVHRVRCHLKKYSPASFAPQTRHLLVDSDAQWFINYLESVVYPGDPDRPECGNLAMHKASVEESLSRYRNEPRKFSKYAWVAGYHNHFCETHNYHFDDEHRIQIDLFRAGPKSILEMS